MKYTEECLRENTVVVGLESSEKSKVIREILETLRVFDRDCIVLTDKVDIGIIKNMTVLTLTDKSRENTYRFLNNLLVVRKISKFTNSTVHNKVLTVIIDDNNCKDNIKKVRDMLEDISNMDNVNYIITAYSKDNGFKGVKNNIEVTQEDKATSFKS